MKKGLLPIGVPLFIWLCLITAGFLVLVRLRQVLQIF